LVFSWSRPVKAASTPPQAVSSARSSDWEERAALGCLCMALFHFPKSHLLLVIFLKSCQPKSILLFAVKSKECFENFLQGKQKISDMI
jgi:hypothetical protein